MFKTLYWRILRGINACEGICCTCAFYNLDTCTCENDDTVVDWMLPDEGCSGWTSKGLEHGR